ncbi:thiamine phosphate synthase [Lacrimispora sp. NSJ-141]|uniref:Thiamine-phosphate synthase n=1 Tax=Lientehia hominis TaxID=2897778 RepID=A0AAP2RGQ2_9FIRM|nr:thiamine phosphate synthase [Lientehia hominis]MCD2491662.1 thiamine phosphate synthase [Lientehia hominis]
MRLLKERGILYVIVDCRNGLSPIEEVLSAGVDLLQLREKGLTSAEYLKRAKTVKALCRKYGTPFIVNDRIDIALLSDADGVHLGTDDVPVNEARRVLGDGLIIGATAKTVSQAVSAELMGADYIGSGAFFQTETKSDAMPISPDTYRQILASISIPDVAIGGITTENCGFPLSLGADGLAIAAGIMKSGDITGSVRAFRKTLSAQ